MLLDSAAEIYGAIRPWVCMANEIERPKSCIMDRGVAQTDCQINERRRAADEQSSRPLQRVLIVLLLADLTGTAMDDG